MNTEYGKQSFALAEGAKAQEFITQLNARGYEWHVSAESHIGPQPSVISVTIWVFYSRVNAAADGATVEAGKGGA